MLSRVKELIKTGWKVTTEAHTVHWIYQGLVYFGVLPAAAAVPAWLAWDNLSARPYLVATGILIWAVLFLCALAYVGHKHQEPTHREPVAFLTPEMEKFPEAPAKPSYTTKEREERYEAWSRIYRVLNDQCSKAVDRGSYVSNTWKESILASPKAYSESMVEFQRMASAALNQVTGIYKEYEYLSDIRDYFENSWGATQHPMNEALNILRDTLKRFPDNPPRAMVDLLDPQAQAFRQGVKGLGRWITEAKAHAAGKIKELSRR